MICTPAATVVELTSWEIKARNFRPLPPLPLVLLEVLQLRNSKLTGRRNDTTIRALFKPWTPRACRIIT
jgi:hypothetical protein